MEYDQRFELQTQERTQDSIGRTGAEWTTAYAGFARVGALGSAEYWQAAAQQREEEVKLFCRWDPRLDVDTRSARILCRGHVYDVKSVENVNCRNEACVIRAVMRSG